MRLGRRVVRRLQSASSWRCKEPVVVFQSDDWGLARRPCAEEVGRFGEPTDWAHEALETVDDLGLLYDVLAAHADRVGNAASFTANLVLTNPDFDAIEQDGFATYHERWIDERNPELVDAYREGVRRGVFAPAFHGRRHFWAPAWLADLKDDVPGARALFDARCPGGLTLLRNQGWRYHSEYLDWRTGAQPDDLQRSVAEAIDRFEKIFDGRPRSVAPPHYIFTGASVRAWSELGLRAVQSADVRMLRVPLDRPALRTAFAGDRGSDGEQPVISSFLGERHDGIVFPDRTVKFDPRPGREGRDRGAASARIRSRLAKGAPIIVDTHRINFTGRFRDDALEQLDGLLTDLDELGVRYLTTDELVDAIRAEGRYVDRGGRPQSLTTPSSATTAVPRSLFRAGRRLSRMSLGRDAC